jgi:hypothetical protein
MFMSSALSAKVAAVVQEINKELTKGSSFQKSRIQGMLQRRSESI